MKHYAIGAFGAACLIALTAPETATAQVPPQDPLVGRWALLFGVSGNFAAGAFDGGTISLARRLSDDRVVRIGGDLAVEWLDARTRSTTDVISDPYEYDRNSVRIAVRTSYLATRRTGRARPYWGAGPVVGYKWWVSDRKGSPDRNAQKTWTFGLGGVIGVEYFASESIGISAEYTPAVTFESFRQEWVYATPGHTTTRTLRANTSDGRIGVSVWF